MNKYYDIDSNIIGRIEFKVPFRCIRATMDPEKVLEILSKIPYECDRVLSEEEVLGFYD